MKEFSYRILEWFTGNKGIKRHISGFEIRIPTRYYKYYEPDYETENIKFIDEHVRTGMTVLDVGAHIGLLSMIFFKKTGKDGKIYSFEPTPSTFKVLKKTIAINNAEGTVIPFNKAVSDKPGVASFYISDIEAHNANSLSAKNANDDAKKKIDIELVSIDRLAEELQLTRIDFIKIDAEGAEYSVLKGAGEVMDKFHPKILLALHPESIRNFGDSLELIWDFLAFKKYTVTHKNDAISKEKFAVQKDLFDVFLIKE